jgi:hypothetical protein
MQSLLVKGLLCTLLQIPHLPVHVCESQLGASPPQNLVLSVILGSVTIPPNDMVRTM